MTSCAEWTGVPLRLLLEEAGVQDGGDWIVAEGVEEVKGASSIHMTKAMDDTLVAYAMNGEALRPQQGVPGAVVVPGFEGILNVKWLRRIKVVDQFYMTYNDYGHLRQEPVDAALGMQVGPKSVITYPSAGQQLPGTGFYQISGLAWAGQGAVAEWKYPPTMARPGWTPRFAGRRIAWRTPGSASTGLGRNRDRAHVALHG